MGQEQEAAVRPVRVMTVEPGAATQIRRLPGRIEAAQTSAVSFQVPGKIEEFPVREGETVEEGALIAALDATDYELALREARVRAEQLRKELDRKRTLRQGGHVSQATLDDAQAAFDLARVAVDRAEQNLDYTRIEAPFKALVAERLVDRFTNVTAGQPVALLQDISTLDVEVSVPEISMGSAPSARTWWAVTASLSAVPERTFPLTIKEWATGARSQHPRLHRDFLHGKSRGYGDSSRHVGDSGGRHRRCRFRRSGGAGGGGGHGTRRPISAYGF